MKNLLNFDYINQFFSRHHMSAISEPLINACLVKVEKRHGDVGLWQSALEKLPDIANPNYEIKSNSIRLTGDCDTNKAQLEATLKSFCPWRKGPFDFLDVHINTEWDSLLKWRRVKTALADANIDLVDNNVLDIGCGNGAFLWPILDVGAKSVTGIDPMWLFYHQFMIMQRYVKSNQLCFLPLGIQDLPLKNSFDAVLSMGILYHRRSPLDHIEQLKGLMKKGATLIIETIVVPDREKILLTPVDRYAGMRNVWMIPSVGVLQDWLQKMGLTILHTSDVVKTTLAEQRQSDWMGFHSLNQFLNNDDDELTIEGHHAPYRVIIVARY